MAKKSKPKEFKRYFGIKSCQDCKWWVRETKPGMNKDLYGFCTFLNNPDELKSFFHDVIFLSGDDVNIREKVSDFKMLTGLNFYCYNFETKDGER